MYEGLLAKDRLLVKCNVHIKVSSMQEPKTEDIPSDIQKRVLH